MVAVVNLKLWFQSRSWSVPLVSSIVFSVSIYILFNIGLAYIRINSGVLNFFNNLFGGETPIDDDIIPVFPAVPDLLRVGQKQITMDQYKYSLVFFSPLDHSLYLGVPPCSCQLLHLAVHTTSDFYISPTRHYN